MSVTNNTVSIGAVVVGGVFVLIFVFITPILILKLGWLFCGYVIFGLTIGLMTGMTKSSIVSAVLPLLFTFAGGSIVALSIGEGRTPQQLDTLGQQLAGFGIGTIMGLLLGVALKNCKIELPLGAFRD